MFTHSSLLVPQREGGGSWTQKLGVTSELVIGGRNEVAPTAILSRQIVWILVVGT